MTNMENPHPLIHDYEQNSIGSAIAGAKQHLADRHVEVGAFRREWTALRKVGECLDTRPCAGTPLSLRLAEHVPECNDICPEDRPWLPA